MTVTVTVTVTVLHTVTVTVTVTVFHTTVTVTVTVAVSQKNYLKRVCYVMFQCLRGDQEIDMINNLDMLLLHIYMIINMNAYDL